MVGSSYDNIRLNGTVGSGRWTAKVEPLTRVRSPDNMIVGAQSADVLRGSGDCPFSFPTFLLIMLSEPHKTSCIFFIIIKSKVFLKMILIPPLT